MTTTVTPYRKTKPTPLCHCGAAQVAHCNVCHRPQCQQHAAEVCGFCDVPTPLPVDLPSAERPRQRSIFVTVVACIFIALTGLGTLIALMQNVIIWVMAGPSGMSGDALPLLLFPAFLLLNAFGLACSIGLLLRRNWARRGFVALLGLGITWMIGGTIAQWVLFADFTVGDESFGAMMTVIKVFNLLLAVGLTVTFGWIIRKLCSLPIKLEFVAPWNR